MAEIALIIGSGMRDHFRLGKGRGVATEFGEAFVYSASVEGHRFILLPRHGALHSVPPHKINYRANIAGLSQLGVKKVIATSAVGSLNRQFSVGSIGLVDQFLDFTKSRAATFFDTKAVHTDMTHPYDRELNRALLGAADRLNLKLHKGLVYACAEGPRFESAAEIRMFKKLGADVVGMTGVPEVVLANELGLDYAALAIATNWAAGIQDSVTHQEVIPVMKKIGKKVKRLLEETIRQSE
jgi:5'-methylthioadenosine phosphorylase